MDEHQSRRILEVSEDASFDEITRAYNRLKSAYGNDQATFVVPFMEEFSSEARSQVLAEIEAAYEVLTDLHESTQTRAPVAMIEPPDPAVPLCTEGLRAYRESAGLSLAQLATRTYMRPEILSALEEERFADLPLAAVNVRGFLTAYLAEIGLPASEIVPGYMERFQAFHKRH